MIDAGSVSERLEEVRARIGAAGGCAQRVKVVAVTKGLGVDAVEAAIGAGLTDLGESYAQELLAKSGIEAGAGVRWHFVGRVQRNKVARVAGFVHLWHSIDRVAAGAEIARRVPGAAVLVQVNASGEAEKSGCRPDDAPGLVAELRTRGLDVRGLMAIGPQGEPEGARPAFRLVTRLADDLGLAERSMGMSDDLEVAVQEGATLVRVGRALFGPRPTAARLRR